MEARLPVDRLPLDDPGDVNHVNADFPIDPLYTYLDNPGCVNYLEADIPTDPLPIPLDDLGGVDPMEADLPVDDGLQLLL